MAPCNACYKNLWTTNAALKRDADLAEHMNYALEADDLHYEGRIEVNHLMDAFSTPEALETDPPTRPTSASTACGWPPTTGARSCGRAARGWS